MLNIIRADMYRIVRSKGLYITLVLLLGFVTLTVIGGSSTVVGIQMWELEESLGAGTDSVYTGLNSVVALSRTMDNLVWFMLPMVIFVAAPMFSYGAVKNCLSCGMSRSKLYAAKLLLSAALCVLMMIVYMGYGMLLGTLRHGFGGPIPEGWWVTLLKTTASQLLILLSLNAVGTFLVFITKRTAIVIGAYIMLCMVPLIVLLILMRRNPDLIWLYDYDLLGTIKKFGYFNALETVDLIHGYAVGAFYLIVPTIAGIALFRRAEIK